MTKLNSRADGPFAYSDAEQVQQWNAVQWLIEYVEDNNENNDATWADWMSAEDIISTYEPAVDDEGDIKNYEGSSTTRLAICTRGKEILDKCIAGEDAGQLMDQWSEEIYETKSEAA